MNEEKKRWIVTIVAGVLVATGLGVLIYFQKNEVEKARVEAESLRTTIAQHRDLIKKTPELVKTVIVQRETDTVIQEILSNEKDINNLVRTLYSFAEESDVTITSLKERRNPAAQTRGRRQDFEQVGYTINFDGDGFHLLSFLNKVEAHKRFMSVTAFKLQAASRNDYEKGDGPRHRIQMDLETYVYTPTGQAKSVKIDHYDRKRDLLISEISKRASELRFKPYDYRGQRGRRDPWIDPRVAVAPEGTPQKPIEEQLEIVAELVDRAHAAELLWQDVQNAGNVIEEMKARARLQEQLAALSEDILKIQDGQILSYVLAEKRFENQVVALVERLNAEAAKIDVGSGPSLALLTETYEVMEAHVDKREYERALEAYATLEGRLEAAEGEERLVMVQALNDLKLLATTVLEFEDIRLEVAGIAVYEGYRPVALINGRPVTEGELVGNELIIRRITPEQIEFAFRGLVLARILSTDPVN